MKSAEASLAFYTGLLGFKLVDRVPYGTFTKYFLATPPAGAALPAPGTEEAHAALFTPSSYTRLCLHHKHGSEADPTFKVESGNVEPLRGFGHIAVTVPDVYAASADLESKGVGFKKRPDEGRMKGLAFALDPDGYWVEIIKRPETHVGDGGYVLNQTMIRVKNPEPTLQYYREKLGLVLLCTRHFSEAAFSLYFLCDPRSIPEGTVVPEDSDAGMELSKSITGAVVELTHNHGTESQEAFSYCTGDPVGMKHLAFTVPAAHLAEAAALLSAAPADAAAPDEEGVLVARDPDGYTIQLLPEGWNHSVSA